MSLDLLKKSDISGKTGEPSAFGQCEFTGGTVLLNELKVSELSRRTFRLDQAQVSTVSGKTGHKSEFISCHETRLPIALVESEQCEETGERVRPGILQQCAVTTKRVLPQELGTCSVSGQRALRKLLVSSSVSGVSLLPSEAVQAKSGLYCLPSETAKCAWSGDVGHPDDVQPCRFTGLSVHRNYLGEPSTLLPLKELLDGLRHNTDASDHWDDIGAKLSMTLRGGKYRITAARTSPGGKLLAARAEAKSMLGLKTSHVGLVYSFEENSLLGRIVSGKPTPQGWVGKETAVR